MYHGQLCQIDHLQLVFVPADKELMASESAYASRRHAALSVVGTIDVKLCLSTLDVLIFHSHRGWTVSKVVIFFRRPASPESADPSGSGKFSPGALAEWSKALDLNSIFSNLISSEACVRTTWASSFLFCPFHMHQGWLSLFGRQLWWRVTVVVVVVIRFENPCCFCYFLHFRYLV